MLGSGPLGSTPLGTPGSTLPIRQGTTSASLGGLGLTTTTAGSVSANSDSLLPLLSDAQANVSVSAVALPSLGDASFINLVLSSVNLTNSFWTSQDVTLDGENILAPDRSTQAVRWRDSSNTRGKRLQSVSITPGVNTYVGSIWVMGETADTSLAALELGLSGGSTSQIAGVALNKSNGDIITYGTAEIVSARVISYTFNSSPWFKLELVVRTLADHSAVEFGMAPATGIAGNGTTTGVSTFWGPMFGKGYHTGSQLPTTSSVQARVGSPLLLSSAGILEVKATVAKTLAGFALTVSNLVEVNGSLSSTLENLDLLADVTVFARTGNLSKVLANVIPTFDSSALFTGDLSAVLDDATGQGTAVGVVGVTVDRSLADSFLSSTSVISLAVALETAMNPFTLSSGVVGSILGSVRRTNLLEYSNFTVPGTIVFPSLSLTTGLPGPDGRAEAARLADDTVDEQPYAFLNPSFLVVGHTVTSQVWIRKETVNTDALANVRPIYITLEQVLTMGVAFNAKTGSATSLGSPQAFGVVDQDANWWVVWFTGVVDYAAASLRIAPARGGGIENTGHCTVGNIDVRYGSMGSPSIDRIVGPQVGRKLSTVLPSIDVDNVVSASLTRTLANAAFISFVQTMGTSYITVVRTWRPGVGDSAEDQLEGIFT